MNGSALSGIPFPDGAVAIESYGTVGALPDDAAALVASAASWQQSAGWWHLASTHARPPGVTPCLMLARLAGQAAGILPLWNGPGSALASLTTPYSCIYEPLLSPRLRPEQRRAVFTAMLRRCWRSPITRLDAIAAEWDGWGDLLAGARAARIWPLPFDHFGNWYADVGGQDFVTWLAHRPGALRETIRRRLRRAATQPGARFELLTQPTEMDHGIAVYQSVYARSWKEPEPFPAFNPALMRWAATQGTLRLGLWWLGATPLAAQYWIVADGQATVLKLAHDEAFRAYSPGTVLTALMLQHLLDQEHVREIDFGRGDDPYKQDWTGSRRQRRGVLLVTPWRLHGSVALLRHAVGRIRTSLTAR
ncbi:MAG: Acetyltransf 6 protein [Chloroflexota bacterium]|nr:Acetyltransf 6 protein [Chloroflexota bacterium]